VQFDSNVTSTTPLSFTVGSGVIAGFTTGVTGMQVGGKRTVIIRLIKVTATRLRLIRAAW
jgi:FKBP-type peptidyl-prolyl cis-trans isomerase